MLSVNFCCNSSTFTPTLLSAPSPASGSCKALPSCLVILVISSAVGFRPPFIAVAVSSIALVASGNASFPTLVNVNNIFSADNIASSSIAVSFIKLCDNSIAASFVTPALPPVDFNTASSCLPALSLSANALTELTPKATAAAPIAATATPIPAEALLTLLPKLFTTALALSSAVITALISAVAINYSFSYHLVS